jgi:homogentisate 1,2-dioxygenase
MNECMGLILGQYDAKASGFSPGGLSLHPRMSAHGPDKETTERATAAELKPHKIDGSIAFMFETSAVIRPTRVAMEGGALQADYDACWGGLPKRFDGKRA